MASALPRRDVSVSWPVCRRPRCGARHLPEYDCPQRGRWLVAGTPVDRPYPLVVLGTKAIAA
jgi:hypothetical protein